MGFEWCSDLVSCATATDGWKSSRECVCCLEGRVLLFLVAGAIVCQLRRNSVAGGRWPSCCCCCTPGSGHKWGRTPTPPPPSFIFYLSHLLLLLLLHLPAFWLQCFVWPSNWIPCLSLRLKLYQTAGHQTSISLKFTDRQQYHIYPTAQYFWKISDHVLLLNFFKISPLKVRHIGVVWNTWTGGSGGKSSNAETFAAKRKNRLRSTGGGGKNKGRLHQENKIFIKILNKKKKKKSSPWKKVAHLPPKIASPDVRLFGFFFDPLRLFLLTCVFIHSSSGFFFFSSFFFHPFQSF